MEESRLRVKPLRTLSALGERSDSGPRTSGEQLFPAAGEWRLCKQEERSPFVSVLMVTEIGQLAVIR